MKNDNELLNSTVDSATTKRKLNLICILSTCLGVISVILGSIPSPGYIIIALNLLIATLGLACAFWGRINTKKTNTRGNGFALTGFILNILLFAGSLVFIIHNFLGNPEKFGIDDATDQKMIILVISSVVICVICACASVVYGIVAKKNK